MPAPVKRGPGRPPGSKNKKTLAKEAATGPGASVNPVTTPAVNSPAPGTTTLVKRGPGRPPGSKNKKTLAKEAGVAMPASNKRPRDVWVVESRTENYGRYHEDETLERKDIHGVFASLRAANKEARKITASEVDGREDSEKIHLSEERDRDDAPFYYCLEEEIDGTTRYVAERCWTIEVRKFPLR